MGAADLTYDLASAYTEDVLRKCGPQARAQSRPALCDLMDYSP